jgi:hypothetical protein
MCAMTFMWLLLASSLLIVQVREPLQKPRHVSRRDPVLRAARR